MSDYDFDLPFEEIPGGPVSLPIAPNSVVSGGVIIRAAAIDTPAGRLPALIFNFYEVSGRPVAPVVLVNDDPEQLRKLVPLVEASVASAIKAAGS